MKKYQALSLDLGLGIENQDFLTKQLITYIGNKRGLIPPILNAVEKVKKELSKDKLVLADVFAGSGVVSRSFKSHASKLYANDFEKYSYLSISCHLSNLSEIPMDQIRLIIKKFNKRILEGKYLPGFFTELYSPKNEKRIKKSDRVFYTRDNALRLDTYCKLIEECDEQLKPFLLAPLIASASVHTNTAGVFKGFYKDHQTGKGKFGGQGADALSRITSPIWLEEPILSNFECENHSFNLDAEDFGKQIPELDLAYLDPPYNQHPYGSNYFMLNLIADYNKPEDISEVSGIPKNWQRSDFNVKNLSFEKLQRVIKNLNTKYILISFSDEGFIKPTQMRKFLNSIGKLDEMKISYNTYRGSRNLKNRNIKMHEHLYLVKVK